MAPAIQNMDALADPVHDGSISTKQRGLVLKGLAFSRRIISFKNFAKVEDCNMRLGRYPAEQLLQKPLGLTQGGKQSFRSRTIILFCRKPQPGDQRLTTTVGFHISCISLQIKVLKTFQLTPAILPRFLYIKKHSSQDFYVKIFLDNSARRSFTTPTIYAKGQCPIA